MRPSPVRKPYPEAVTEHPHVIGRRPNMTKTKRWAILVVSGLILLLLAVAALKIVFLDLVVDYWWFKSLDFTLYFCMRLLYRYAVFLAAAFLVFLLFFFNFLVASRQVSLGEKDKEYRDLLEKLR